MAPGTRRRYHHRAERQQADDDAHRQKLARVSLDMMFKGLNLTDAQKQQIRDIMKSQRENMKRPSLEERRAMHDLIASDTFDKAKAEAQIDKMEAQHKAMALSRLETQNKIYNILTPEQKKQFNANFEKHLTERNAPAGKMPAPAE
ncbi:ATP-independent periplasmic protein-refolding chaperone Spy [Klebsiella pneumoniae]|nr:ATP-independent periplasmic protein-refolding chaperone Spy [Klebsiella pneumoniae]